MGTLDQRNLRVGTGLVGNPTREGVIRLQIQVNEQGLIETVRFKAYGCGYTIACGSLLSQWVKDANLDQARAIQHTQIAQALALPVEKIHCSVLAEDALSAAIADYEAKNANINPSNTIQPPGC